MKPYAVAAPDAIQIPALAVREPAVRRRHLLSVLDLSPDEVLYLCRRMDVVYTSRWQEMGVSKPDPAWRSACHPFRVTRALMERVSGGRPAMFVHDLPAVRGEDVDDEVLDGAHSLARVQAQHTMFSAMAGMEWCGMGVVGAPL